MQRSRTGRKPVLPGPRIHVRTLQNLRETWDGVYKRPLRKDWLTYWSVFIWFAALAKTAELGGGALGFGERLLGYTLLAIAPFWVFRAIRNKIQPEEAGGEDSIVINETLYDEALGVRNELGTRIAFGLVAVGGVAFFGFLALDSGSFDSLARMWSEETNRQPTSAERETCHAARDVVTAIRASAATPDDDTHLVSEALRTLSHHANRTERSDLRAASARAWTNWGYSITESTNFNDVGAGQHRDAFLTALATVVTTCQDGIGIPVDSSPEGSG